MSDEINSIVSEDSEGYPPEYWPLRWADWFFSIVAGAILFGMMSMTFVDVIGRYFFNAPLGFAFEMTQVAMAAAVFCALPSVTLRQQHITAGLFDNVFSGTAKVVRDFLITLVIFVACLFLAWRLSKLAERFISFGDVTSAVRFPIGIVAWMGVIALVLSAIAALLVGITIVHRAFGSAKQ